MVFDTLSRSWNITKQTFSVINADKEIMLFPILSSIFSIIFFVLMIVPFLASGIVGSVLPDDVGALLYWISLFVFYLGVSFIATFFNVATVYCAKKRFDGGDPTFSEGLKAAFKRIHLILLWSIVSATVGLLLRALENAARNSSGAGKIIISIVRSVLGLAWSIVTVFVVPALVIENVGPFEAIKRSVDTLKKTWGESLVRYYGLGMAQTAFIFVGIVLLLVPALVTLFYFQSFLVFAVLIGLFILFVAVVSVVFSTANTVFNTALYVYAKTGKVPGVYDQETMQHAFRDEKRV